jgi:hypothetical protein
MNFLLNAFEAVMPMIEKSAPMIASAMGGPIAGIATTALILIKNAFGLPTEATPADLLTAIQSHPDAETILAKLNATHGTWLAKVVSMVDNPTTAEINVKLTWNRQQPT